MPRVGNKNRETHGAGAAEVALTTGADLSGLALQAEQNVNAELETAGIGAIVRRDAIRLQTVADLYYAAIMGADTLDKLDSLVKRYGWIQASALRAWQQVQDTDRQHKPIDLSTVLASMEGGEDGSNNNT